jgi:hypothetical protein
MSRFLFAEAFTAANSAKPVVFMDKNVADKLEYPRYNRQVEMRVHGLLGGEVHCGRMMIYLNLEILSKCSKLTHQP